MTFIGAANKEEGKIMESAEARALRWALGDKVGSSSKSIARHMMGMDHDSFGAAYPADGGDLGRCLALLDAVPEWRARLPEMARHSPAWAALVGSWDELTEMHRGGSSKIYDRMQEILRKPEAADRNLIKFGNGTSIRFGRAR